MIKKLTLSLLLLFTLISSSFGLIITDNTLTTNSYLSNTSNVLINISTDLVSTCSIIDNNQISHNLNTIDNLTHTYNYLITSNEIGQTLNYNVSCTGADATIQTITGLSTSIVLGYNPNLNCMGGIYSSVCYGNEVLSGLNALGQPVNASDMTIVCQATLGSGYTASSWNVLPAYTQTKFRMPNNTTIDRFSGGQVTTSPYVNSLTCSNPLPTLITLNSLNSFSIQGQAQQPQYYPLAPSSTIIKLSGQSFNQNLLNYTLINTNFNLSLPNTTTHFITNYGFNPNYYNSTLELMMYQDSNYNFNFLLTYNNKHYIMKTIDSWLFNNGLAGQMDFSMLYQNLTSTNAMFLFTPTYLNDTLFNQIIPSQIVFSPTSNNNLVTLNATTSQLPKIGNDVGGFLSNLAPTLADFILNLSILIILSGIIGSIILLIRRVM